MQSNSTVLFKSSMITLTIMILGMVVIGGLTRLTGSGLSIVEWKPIVGLTPPLSTEAWMQEFAKYQQSPEFLKINFGMTLTDFQSIFWLEYIHRLWGRVLGLLLLIPTFLIVYKGQQRKLWPLLTLLWALGFAQAILGWWMVKSGLSHDPHVSPYRLAAHLFLGFAIFGVSLWMTLELWIDKKKKFSNFFSDPLLILSMIAIILFLSTAFLGALVAGLKAGLVYNTFPFMGDTLVPRELLTQSPWWKDIFENPVSVQFLHRCFAIFTTCFCVGLWAFQRSHPLPRQLSSAFTGVMSLALLQFTLGIATLLMLVPHHLAALHQGVAFLLFGSLVYTVFLLKVSTGKNKSTLV